jgi:hypothetical protein
MIPAALLLALLPQAVSPAAPVEVQATVASDSVKIGEPFTYTVAVSGIGAGARIIFPELPDTGDVTALAPPQVPADQPAGSRTARYRLAAWRSGELGLPAAQLVVIRDGAELTIPLPDVSVRVTSVVPAGADPDTLSWQPPADVVGANWSLGEKLIGAGLALAILLFALAYVRRRIVSHPVPPPPAKTPAERALGAFQLLATSGLLEAGELKAFYSALSHVLRQFLAESDDNWSLDRTTGEIVRAVGRDGVAEEAKNELEILLVEADIVKFARRRPSRIRASRALEAARDWVASYERSEPELELELALAADGQVEPLVVQGVIIDDGRDDDDEYDDDDDLEDREDGGEGEGTAR